MLNEGTRTTELSLAGWILDPDASDAEIIEAMRLPRNLSLETLLTDEAAAVRPYHQRWTLSSGLDTGGLFLRNSTCRRALYLSAPLVLPDNIPTAKFVPTGTNTRIHIYNAADAQDTVRLEAISSFEVGELRFRYALSIQYAADSVGLGWQVIRPVIVIDRQITEAVRRAGTAARQRLERLLDALRELILLGSHDYVHATVLNWFPPLRNLAPDYARITSERAHPPEIEQWHQGSQTALPPGLVAGRPTPGIATLELYSLLVHAETIARMWAEDPRVRQHIRHLVRSFCAALAALTGDRLFGSDAADAGVSDYFMTLALWFLVSALPLGSGRLAHALAAATPRDAAGRALGHLAAAHEGMFEFVPVADPARFPWRGRRVPVHEVAAEYECALRWPAIREHLQYLLLPRRAGGQGCWAGELLAPLPDAQRAGLLAALDGLRACRQQEDGGRRLAGLADGGQIGVLRRVSRPRGEAGPAESGPARHARAVLASFVAVADSIQESRLRCPA